MEQETPVIEIDHALEVVVAEEMSEIDRERAQMLVGFSLGGFAAGAGLYGLAIVSTKMGGALAAEVISGAEQVGSADFRYDHLAYSGAAGATPFALSVLVYARCYKRDAEARIRAKAQRLFPST